MKRPVAPAVYRPQPVPRVLQRRIAVAQSPKPNHLPRPPVVASTNRPQIKPAIAQTKMAGAPRMRTPPVAPPVYRPQATPMAVQQKRQARTNSVVQRYTRVDIKELGGVGRLSQNGHYFVPGLFGFGGLLYAAVDAAVPRNSDAKDDRKPANGKTYQGYISKNFVNDCLHTAEEIINQRNLDEEGIFSRVAGTHEDFGDTDEENIRLAGIRASDDKADPALGQAYVIVNQKWLKPKRKRKGYVEEEKKEYPFHAAAVVATDGNDRITLETCAGLQHAAARDTKGEYHMYTTDGDGEKFHTYWQDRLFGRSSATLVIERKP